MNYSIYLHIPFCKRRCHYCDFNTYAGKEELLPGYVESLIDEIRIVIDHKMEINVQTVYFGGGTPSLVPVSLYAKLMRILRNNCKISEDVEISLEANPGTLSQEYLYGMRELGFNRISIGVQSTNPQDLERLEVAGNKSDARVFSWFDLQGATQ